MPSQLFLKRVSEREIKGGLCAVGRRKGKSSLYRETENHINTLSQEKSCSPTQSISYNPNASNTTERMWKVYRQMRRCLMSEAERTDSGSMKKPASTSHT